MILKNVEEIMNIYLANINLNRADSWEECEHCFNELRNAIDEAPIINAMPIEQVARILYKASHNSPCKVLSRPAFDSFDKWCVENCIADREKIAMNCWLHAIKEGWVR